MGVAETSSAAGLRAGCTVGARSELDAHGSAAHRPRWVVCAVPPLSPSSVRSSGRLKTAALPLGCAHASARLNARCCRKARRAAPHRTAPQQPALQANAGAVIVIVRDSALDPGAAASPRPMYSTVLYCTAVRSTPPAPAPAPAPRRAGKMLPLAQQWQDSRPGRADVLYRMDFCWCVAFITIQSGRDQGSERD